jgi:hypothetical protein
VQFYATPIRYVAFAAIGREAQMTLDAAAQQAHIHKGRQMFSLISLYFSYRRDVLLAERYVAGLAEKPAQDAAVPEARIEAPKSEDLALAA